MVDGVLYALESVEDGGEIVVGSPDLAVNSETRDWV